MADADRSPVERVITRSYVDESSGLGKPLSRRARQTRRSVETYLSAGDLPRYMQRLREVDRAIAAHRAALERSHRRLREACGEDAGLFARRWRELALRWRFDDVNELIHEHNEWYPIEAQLPLDPRTRDYVRIRGRSYRRRELTAAWVLELFPVSRAA